MAWYMIGADSLVVHPKKFRNEIEIEKCKMKCAQEIENQSEMTEKTGSLLVALTRESRKSVLSLTIVMSSARSSVYARFDNFSTQTQT